MNAGIVYIDYGYYDNFKKFARRGLSVPFHVINVDTRRDCFRTRTFLFDLSPFDVTAYVDLDMINLATDEQWYEEIFSNVPEDNIVLRNTHSLCHVPLLHYPNVEILGGPEEVIKYPHVVWPTGGMIVFRKTHFVERIFNEWKKIYDDIAKRKNAFNEEISLAYGIMHGIIPQPVDLDYRWNVNYNNTSLKNSRGFPVEKCRLIHAVAGSLDHKVSTLQKVLDYVEKL